MKPEMAIQYSAFLLFALPITFYDIRDYRIPDFLTLGGLLVLSTLKLFLAHTPVTAIALECSLGFGVFWLIHRVTSGRLGLGDAKYSALIAVAVGLLPWFVTLLIASVAGLFYAAIMIVFFRMDRARRIPFAPFLTLGAAVSVAASPLLQRL
jgi:prepilin signal peptidase PulO-like enzyme (type II secretory pathway)